MFNRGGIADDIFGELLETGQAVKKQASQLSPGKILKTAGQQIAGAGKPKKPNEDSDTFSELMKSGYKKNKDFDPTKVTEEQLKQMKSKDKKQSLENYRKIQQELLQLYLRKKQKELPAYQAGKAGAARTYDEEKQLIEKKRKETEKRKKESQGPLLPKSARKMPGLGLFEKQRQGTGEIKLGKMG